MTQVTIPVPIVDDRLDEEDEERFTASLTQVTVNDRVTISRPEAEVLITDDDGNSFHKQVSKLLVMMHGFVYFIDCSC